MSGGNSAAVPLGLKMSVRYWVYSSRTFLVRVWFEKVELGIWSARGVVNLVVSRGDLNERSRWQ